VQKQWDGRERLQCGAPGGDGCLHLVLLAGYRPCAVGHPGRGVHLRGEDAVHDSVQHVGVGVVLRGCQNLPVDGGRRRHPLGHVGVQWRLPGRPRRLLPHPRDQGQVGCADPGYAHPQQQEQGPQDLIREENMKKLSAPDATGMQKCNYFCTFFLLLNMYLCLIVLFKNPACQIINNILLIMLFIKIPNIL